MLETFSFLELYKVFNVDDIATLVLSVSFTLGIADCDAFFVIKKESQIKVV